MIGLARMEDIHRRIPRDEIKSIRSLIQRLFYYIYIYITHTHIYNVYIYYIIILKSLIYIIHNTFITPFPSLSFLFSYLCLYTENCKSSHPTLN